MSSRGATQVAGQRLQVGFAHRHTLVDVVVHDAEFHVYDQPDPLAVIPRTSSKEVTGTKGHGVRGRILTASAPNPHLSGIPSTG